MVPRLRKANVVDPEGDRIGTVGEVWLEEGSQEPVWVSVHTGLFGMKESFVPLRGAEADSDALHVAVRREQVKEAPRVDADGRLTSDEERALYAHYGFGPQGGRGTGPGQPPRDRADVSRPGNGSRTPDESMTRSEERLRVGKENVESGHVRLRKYVVTEHEQVSVPVRHEELRMEREPIPDGTATGTSIGEDQRDITLHEERPVVHTETMPMERVRLDKELVTENETVGGDIRKEQFDVDEGTDPRRQRRT
jgi:uncharacterized protein (TIGR02271 family)